ncbi:MAG: hypothetical protein ABIN69_00035 [Aestuariivirga sp.]
MQPFKFTVALAAWMAVAGMAQAGQSSFGEKADGVVVSYDNTQWDASKLVGHPYFVCNAPDCGTASCMVLASLDPDFAVWPEKIDEASLAALQNDFLDYVKSGGHNDAEVVAPMQAVKIGSHDVIYGAIANKKSDGSLSSRYMMREAGGPRIVTCEGDAGDLTKLKPQIDILVGGMTFYQK